MENAALAAHLALHAEILADAVGIADLDRAPAVRARDMHGARLKPLLRHRDHLHDDATFSGPDRSHLGKLESNDRQVALLATRK